MGESLDRLLGGGTHVRGDREIDKYQRDCTNIEPLALQEEFVRVPADMAHWNGKYADAFEDYEQSKLHTRRLESLIQIEVRDRLARDGGKTTEKAVESAVAGDPRLQAAEDEQLRTEVQLVRLKGVCEAVRCKREMIVSLGAHVRSEMQMDPIIKNQHRVAHDRE